MGQGTHIQSDTRSWHPSSHTEVSPAAGTQPLQRSPTGKTERLCRELVKELVSMKVQEFETSCGGQAQGSARSLTSLVSHKTSCFSSPCFALLSFLALQVCTALSVPATLPVPLYPSPYHLYLLQSPG